MGLPLDFLEKYTSRVRGVTSERLQAAAARHFNPEAAAIVVVGDAAQIGKPLEEFGQVTVEEAR
jgi:predicted Zn-dependent peptidase